MYRTRETWEGKDPEAMVSKVTLRIAVWRRKRSRGTPSSVENPRKVPEKARRGKQRQQEQQKVMSLEQLMLAQADARHKIEIGMRCTMYWHGREHEIRKTSKGG